MKFLIILAIILIVYRFWIMPGLKKAKEQHIHAGHDQFNGKSKTGKPKVGEYIEYEEIKKKAKS